MRDAEVVRVLTDQHVILRPLDPAEFGALIKKDLDKWAPIIKGAGIKGGSSANVGLCEVMCVAVQRIADV